MAINFPNNPSVNDEHEEGNVKFRWNGVKWRPVSTSALVGDDNVTLATYATWRGGTDNLL